jgi:hypothetical protein
LPGGFYSTSIHGFSPLAGWSQDFVYRTLKRGASSEPNWLHSLSKLALARRRSQLTVLHETKHPDKGILENEDTGEAS